MPSQGSLVARRVAGLVLAAGRSARMGAATNKMTIEVDGAPLVAWPVDAMRGAGIQRPLVVTGFESDAVQSALAGRGCVFSHHAAWQSGMGASLAFGVAAVRAEEIRRGEEFDAILVALGDLPGLRASVIEDVLGAASVSASVVSIPTLAEAVRGRIVIPVFEGQRGHPVLLGREFWPALEALSGDQGAKTIVGSAGEALVEVEVETDSILADVDTPEDLAGWRARRR